MSDYYDGRYCHPLTLYEEDKYKVVRTKFARVEIQMRQESVWYDYPRFGEKETIVWWKVLKIWNSAFSYITADRKGKLAWNKKWAERGRQWVERWKTLLDRPMWKVRCDNWDGQGTPCPIQKIGEDISGCPIKFFYMGYGGNPSDPRPLPDECDGPINSRHTLGMCVPSQTDEHEFSMNHLAHIRHLIWKREQKGETAK